MNKIKNIEKILHFAKIKNKKTRKKFVDECDEEIVREVVEIIANFLRGNICIPKENVRNMRYHSKKLRKLAKTRSFKNAKDILCQTGGWANILVPLLVAIGGSCVTKLLNEVYK